MRIANARELGELMSRRPIQDSRPVLIGGGSSPELPAVRPASPYPTQMSDACCGMTRIPSLSTPRPNNQS
jgi:hypothetical protein